MFLPSRNILGNPLPLQGSNCFLQFPFKIRPTHEVVHSLAGLISSSYDQQPLGLQGGGRLPLPHSRFLVGRGGIFKALDASAGGKTGRIRSGQSDQAWWPLEVPCKRGRGVLEGSTLTGPWKDPESKGHPPPRLVAADGAQPGQAPDPLVPKEAGHCQPLHWQSSNPQHAPALHPKSERGTVRRSRASASLAHHFLAPSSGQPGGGAAETARPKCPVRSTPNGVDPQRPTATGAGGSRAGGAGKSREGGLVGVEAEACLVREEESGCI